MKHICTAIVLVVLAASICGARSNGGQSFPAATKADTKDHVFVVGNHSPPYRIFGDGPPRGIYIDIMLEMARRLNLQVHFLEVPFVRALHMMESGHADIMLGPNRTPERERYLIFNTVPIHSETKAFYIRSDSPDLSAYQDLYGKSICCVNGQVYFTAFDTDTSLRKDPTPNYESAFKKLMKGRCDALITPERQGAALSRRYGDDVKRASYVARGNPSHITVSVHSEFACRINEFDSVLLQMRQDGAYDRIVARYPYGSADQPARPFSMASTLDKKTE